MKFSEMRDLIKEKDEYGFRMMIADEMRYAIEDFDTVKFNICKVITCEPKEVDDDNFNMLCSVAENAYLATSENPDISHLCSTVYIMYCADELESAGKWDVLNAVITYFGE